MATEFCIISHVGDGTTNGRLYCTPIQLIMYPCQIDFQICLKNSFVVALLSWLHDHQTLMEIVCHQICCVTVSLINNKIIIIYTTYIAPYIWPVWPFIGAEEGPSKY